MRYRLGTRRLQGHGNARNSLNIPSPKNAKRKVREEYREFIEEIENINEADIYYDDDEQAIVIKPLKIEAQ